MEPIISPWIIYVLGLLGPMIAASWVLCIGAFVVAGFCFGVGADAHDDEQASLYKFGRKMLHTSVLALVLLVFIPTRDTVITMFVANEITTDRVELVGDVAQDVHKAVKQDILDLIGAIQNEEDNNE